MKNYQKNLLVFEFTKQISAKEAFNFYEEYNSNSVRIVGGNPHFEDLHTYLDNNIKELGLKKALENPVQGWTPIYFEKPHFLGKTSRQDTLSTKEK